MYEIDKDPGIISQKEQILQCFWRLKGHFMPFLHQNVYGNVVQKIPEFHFQGAWYLLLSAWLASEIRKLQTLFVQHFLPGKKPFSSPTFKEIKF